MGWGGVWLFRGNDMLKTAKMLKQRRHIKLNCVSLLLRLKDLKFKHLINFQPGY